MLPLVSGVRFESVPIERPNVAALRIPTEGPECDGTYAWDSTIPVTVHASAGGARGFGYTYGSAAVVPLVAAQLRPRVLGSDAFAIEGIWSALVAEVRNVGRPGIAATAISAIDAALWRRGAGSARIGPGRASASS